MTGAQIFGQRFLTNYDILSDLLLKMFRDFYYIWKNFIVEGHSFGDRIISIVFIH